MTTVKKFRIEALAVVCGLVTMLDAVAADLPASRSTPERQTSSAVFAVPNFHPASCGWLTDFSTERNYCANSYLDHLDRVGSDDDYAFVISEANTMIAIRNFAPDRFDELKRRIAEGRVEAVNAFFLEPTINLSGGEALVKQGIEGLRWQEALLGVRPRHCWMIDVTGMHEQMPQIARLSFSLRALAPAISLISPLSKFPLIGFHLYHDYLSRSITPITIPTPKDASNTASHGFRGSVSKSVTLERIMSEMPSDFLLIPLLEQSSRELTCNQWAGVTWRRFMSGNFLLSYIVKDIRRSAPRIQRT